MSILGFDKSIANIRSTKRLVLSEMMAVAKKEFKSNFDTESNTETGESWKEITEVTRSRRKNSDNPILEDTGSLKNATVNGNVLYTENTATLTVNPVDNRGREYAKYHQDGDGVEERAYITQSQSLTRKQEEIIFNNINQYL